MQSTSVINTREDLDALQETSPVEYTNFMEFLKGSMTRKQDVAAYPEGYNQPDYAGDKIEPVWQDVEDLSTIERFGFQKADFA